MASLIKKIFGDTTSRALKEIEPVVREINKLESIYQNMSDQELSSQTTILKEKLNSGHSLDDVLPYAYAVVRETSKRVSGERHFDVQLLGGVVMHGGGIAEMRTGEGKTLVATLPAYLNALTEKGVHVVTVNDYLANRDTAWMGQIYSFLGLSVGVINSGGDSFLYDPSYATQESTKDEERDELGYFKVVHDFLRPCTRQEAYRADITYGTNSEFGFDYLRDHITYDKGQLRQRKFSFAIIDEIDSILIDEARTPLIISAPSAQSENLYATFSAIARSLKEKEDYEVDEKKRAVTLTDSGIEKAEHALGVENIYTEGGIKYVHHLETAVRAKALFKLDKEYVVKDGQVIIIDQFTGRMMSGRRFSEGMHQAIEAKEGVTIKQESRTFASVTYQNFFRLYKKLSGMTGTAATSAEEFYKVYGLDTVIVPTNRPIQRKDHDDFIFQSTQGKYEAVAKKVRELNEKGQPVLIGTVSVENNELLTSYLSQKGLTFNVLNAKQHEREGEIVAEAGKEGAVTIATNMAGRGVDIKLGGKNAKKEEHEKVKANGGLFVLGTERHEARRIDNQLRGRAGRQGDPGETQFFVSLEDDLMRVFASDTIKNMMGRFNIPEDQPIENKLITRALESAQEKIEGLHFDSRKHVLQFDDVLNHQRKTIYERRMSILLASIQEIKEQVLLLASHDESFENVLIKRVEEFGEEIFFENVRKLMLQTIDMMWVEHLEMMDYMRSSVNLRAYGQRDPLVEYKKEGLQMFKEMEIAIDEQILDLIPKIGASIAPAEKQKLQEIHKSAQTLGKESDSGRATSLVPKHSDGSKIGRNDHVKITNGSETKELKFKKAEPLLESGKWKLV